MNVLVIMWTGTYLTSILVRVFSSFSSFFSLLFYHFVHFECKTKSVYIWNKEFMFILLIFFSRGNFPLKKNHEKRENPLQGGGGERNEGIKKIVLNWTNFFGGEHQTNILFPFYSWITISFLPIWIVPFPMLFFIPSKFSTFIHSNLLSFYLVWIIELYIRMTLYETKKKFRFLNSRSSFDYQNVHGKKFLFFGCGCGCVWNSSSSTSPALCLEIFVKQRKKRIYFEFKFLNFFYCCFRSTILFLFQL